jgi:outer membrane protein assembly factor BamB
MLLATCAMAGDWPEFRGPTHQGRAESTNLPIEWSPEQNVAWKIDVPGEGWSSPVVVDGQIYLSAAVAQAEDPAKNYLLGVLAFDAKTGRELWKQPIFEQDASAPGIHSKNSHASPTPLVYDGSLWVHFGHMGTARLNTQGKVIWKQLPVPYKPVHGNGGSPVLADGKLIFSVDGANERCVVALDAATGNEVWKTDRPGDPRKGFAFCTPLVIEVDGRQLVVSPGAGTIDALDVQTGDLIWTVNHGGYSVIPRPVFANGLVYVSTSYDSPEVLAIDPTGSGDVTDTHVRWKLKRGAPHTPSMIVDGNELYMVSDRGVASCVDALTGEAIWQERVPGNYSASPVLAGGHIYFTSEEGRTSVVRAGREFELVAENDLGERTLASMAVVDDALLIRTASKLWRIEKK